MEKETNLSSNPINYSIVLFTIQQCGPPIIRVNEFRRYGPFIQTGQIAFLSAHW